MIIMNTKPNKGAKNGLSMYTSRYFPLNPFIAHNIKAPISAMIAILFS